MVELLGINIGLNSNSILFLGGILYTVGTLLGGGANIAKYGGYGVMIGVIWHFASNVLGIF
jgi:hypothetical protein